MPNKVLVMPETKQFTPKQAALVERLRQSATHDLEWASPPWGREERGKFYIIKPYSEEDSRTVQSLINRGVLIENGDGNVKLSQEFLS